MQVQVTGKHVDVGEALRTRVADELSTSIGKYFDRGGDSLGVFPVPSNDRGLSFLGVAFADPVVARVRITYGNTPLGPAETPLNGVDVAVMDDFIYGEPQPR